MLHFLYNPKGLSLIISFSTHIGGLDTAQGYGVAGYNIVKSLQALGHQVPFASTTAPVQLNFTQPYYYSFNKPQYQIGYTPWESTKLMDGWLDAMNQCDEVWSASDLMIKWFKAQGVTRPLYVYEHGISHDWAPRERKVGDQIRFLHVGEPAPRKCGQMVVDAFAELFGNDPNYHLTLKSNGYQTTRVYKGTGMLFTPDEYYSNVDIITKVLDPQDLIDLHYDHDVLIYPSWGEGFGFIPIQAAASGMPVVMNRSWAPYRRLVTGPSIKDRLVASRWPDTHPGNMLEPDKESLKEALVKITQKIEHYESQAFELAHQIHKEYDWQSVTQRAFQHVFDKFE